MEDTSGIEEMVLEALSHRLAEGMRQLRTAAFGLAVAVTAAQAYYGAVTPTDLYTNPALLGDMAAAIMRGGADVVADTFVELGLDRDMLEQIMASSETLLADMAQTHAAGTREAVAASKSR